MAGEAALAQELALPFASLCTVDNFSHGLVEQALTMETIIEHARRNAEATLRILTRYIERDAHPTGQA
jgi:purine nucleoside phosphorylase